MNCIVRVIDMKCRASGIVTDVQGGCGFVKRLQSLGIQKGKRITKISSGFMAGPVVVLAGQTRLAIGRGMASRILVEITA